MSNRRFDENEYDYQYSGGYARPRPNKRRRKNFIGKLAALLLALIILLAGGAALLYFSVVNPGGTGFYEGVYIDDAAMANLTPEQAFAMIDSKVKERAANFSVTLSYGGETWRVTGTDIGLTADVAGVVNQAYQVGRVGDAFKRFQDIRSLSAQPARFYTTMFYNEYQIDYLVSQIKSEIDVAAVNAERIEDPNRTPPYYFKGESAGLSLDAAALTAEINELAQTLTPGHITLAPERVEPTVRQADLQNEFVRISRARTPISKSSTAERTANVAKGCEIWNGMTIAPGQRVSFNKVVGPRTIENGWNQALEIVSGEYRLDYGGGICQVSSTLYYAAVEAGLTIIERSAHGLPINYMDPGKDATVYYTGKSGYRVIDLVFENNTGSTVQIIAKVEKYDGNPHCIFEFYGRPDVNGYAYYLETQTLSTIPVPEEKKIIADVNGEYTVYIGETRTVPGSRGYEVNSYRVVKRGAVEIERTLIATDIYAATSTREYHGVTPRE
ncbi:MAG: VanW family protein [Oscillospiraceae bacterium]|nr:VanW family protein [Oscillospiraceae bacterium]